MNLSSGNPQMPCAKDKENKTEDNHSDRENNDGTIVVYDSPRDSSGDEDDTDRYTFHGIRIITHRLNV